MENWVDNVLGVLGVSLEAHQALFVRERHQVLVRLQVVVEQNRELVMENKVLRFQSKGSDVVEWSVQLQIEEGGRVAVVFRLVEALVVSELFVASAIFFSLRLLRLLGRALPAVRTRVDTHNRLPVMVLGTANSNLSLRFTETRSLQPS